MSFRTRLAVLVGACVALAVALAAIIAFVAVRSRLESQIDGALRNRAATALSQHGFGDRGDLFRLLGGWEGDGVAGQLVLGDGTVYRDPHMPSLPITPAVQRVARSYGDATSFDATVEGTPVRILAVGLGGGNVLELARTLSDVQATLRFLRIVFLAIAIGGVAVAAALGWLVARSALRPVRQLTDEAESVRATGDLSRRVEVGGRDELGRLAARFNEMLAALERSRTAQRRLVADASHELRTPLTSLRTNIEVVPRLGELPPEARASLLRDLRVELDQLATLVADLVELGSDTPAAQQPEPVQLDELVNDVVARTRRRAPELAISAELEPCVVLGVPSRLERAVGNLLDNAVKWSASGGSIEVRVRSGEVTVRDHGPGIAAEDLPHVFDRFFRAPSARGMPGSGLGLAIVRQVVDEHGGRVAAERAEGGGTLMRLRLPAVATLPEPSAPLRAGHVDARPARL